MKLRDACKAGFPATDIVAEQSTGYDGAKTGVLHILARRDG